MGSVRNGRVFFNQKVVEFLNFSLTYSRKWNYYRYNITSKWNTKGDERDLLKRILGLLNYGDMSGYEIKTIFQQSLNTSGPLNQARFSQRLQSLKDDWVTSTLVLKKESQTRRSSR